MKKQIFKLTSILLAMVMVFTMFTIVPISAEDTANLSTAVEDLKTAWKNLTYIGDGFTQSVPMNYFASTWQGQANYAQSDATVQGSASYVLPFNATAKNLIYTAEKASASATLRGTSIGIKDVESIYFYYKSDRDFKFGLQVHFSNGATAQSKTYSSNDTMSSSNNEWVPFDLVTYFNARNAAGAGVPSFSELQSSWGEATPYISRLTLSNLTAALGEGEESVNVSFSNLFVRADANIYSLETDIDWYEKAVAVDPATLKAEYKDAENSDEWQAFLAAREAVLTCSAEVAEAKLRVAAEEMISSETSYAYPSGVGRTWKERTPNDKAVDIYGDYTLTTTMGNTNATGIWMHQSVDSYVNGNNQTSDANLRFGDYGENPYFMIKVNNITGADTVDIGFWGRFSGTPIGGSNKDYYSNYTKTVEKDGEYKIYIDDILKNIETSDTNVNAKFDDWKSHFLASLAGVSGASSLAAILSTYVATAGATADVTIGSIVDTSNYEITSENTGAQFVAEMAALDITGFGNTDAFEAALEIALDEFPEANKLAAVEKLRVAAGKMVTYGDSVLAPNVTYISGRVANTLVDSATANYGSKTTTVDLPAVTTWSGSTAPGVWYKVPTDTGTSSDASTYIGGGTGEAYLTFKVNSIDGDAASTTIRFRFRGSTTANLCNVNTASTFSLTVEAGKEYTVSLSEVLAGTDAADWQTYFSTTYFNFLNMNAVGAAANVTLGSFVYKNNYVPSSNKGVDFVTEMVALKANDSYASYDNKDEFEEALNAALALYPEIGEAVAKQAALDNLDDAWENLVPFYANAPLGLENINNWITYNDSYKEIGANDFFGESAVSYKVSAPANPGGTGAVGEKNPSNKIYNEIAWTNEPGKTSPSTYLTDIKKVDIEDLYFYYKSSARIYAKPVITYSNGSQISSSVSSVFGDQYVLPASDGDWVKVSFIDFICNPNNGTYTATNWTNRYATTSGSDYEYLTRVYFQISAASQTDADVLFSDIFVEYGSDQNREGSADWTDEQLVRNALTLGDTAMDAGYLDTAEWQTFLAARTEALKYYPEIEEEIAEELAKANAIEELRAAAKEMITSSSAVAHAGGYYTTGRNNFSADEYTYYTTADEEYLTYGTELSPGYPLPAQTSRTLQGIWITGAVANASSNAMFFGNTVNSDAYVTVYVDSVADASASPSLNFYTRWNDGTGQKDPTGVYTVNVTAGETYEVKLSDILAANNIKISDLTTANKKYVYFFALQAGGCDITVRVGAMMTKEYYQPSNATDIDFLREMYCIDADDYLNNENFKAKLAAAVALYGEEELITAKAAKKVIDASENLNKVVALKPTKKVTSNSNGNIESDVVFGTSNNGDLYTTVNTDEYGNETCYPTSGAVIYEAKAPIKLADIDDIHFSYKVDNFEKEGNGSTGARIWFYEENYTYYKRTTGEDGEEIILDGKDGKETVVEKNEWRCGMEAYGSTRWLAFNADTDGWVETSLATIFGADWKTVYLGYLNTSDIASDEFTEDNTYITKLSFGFNGAKEDVYYADVSVGSMYVEKAQNDYTISASYLNADEVLAEARTIDLTGVNKAAANEFKTLVKELETMLDAEAANGNFVSGNYGAASATIADLSVLAQYVDGTLGDDFIDLDCADINEDGKYDEEDVKALRVALLNQ